MSTFIRKFGTVLFALWLGSCALVVALDSAVQAGADARAAQIEAVLTEAE